MGKSIRVITKKKRGRPVTTGKGTLIGVRLLDAPLAVLDNWIAEQDEPHLTRPEAIRRLVEIGLSKSRRPKTEGLTPPPEKALRIMDDMAGALQKIGPKAKK